MHFLLRGVTTVFTILALAMAYLIWNNNRTVSPTGKDQLNGSLENGIQWLKTHEQSILDTQNPMLWHLVQQAGDISGDPRLTSLFSDYEKRYLDNNPNNIWRPLFKPGTWVPIRFEDIASFPYYNWHFIYASTCDSDLEKVPEIAAQNTPSFCDRYPLRPACATHQMMGLLLLKRSHCGDPAQLENTIDALQQRIYRQLTWDPRVVDVYMQRVLMLVESGAGTKVKPVWLKHLLDAQQPDGGWSPFMPLVPVGGGRAIGTSRLISIGKPESDFHMTAQGVLLLTLLTHPPQ